MAGDTIRMLRKTHGINQRDLAALVGITTSHLSRVETGERPASPGLMTRIVAALASLPVKDQAS